MSATDSLSAIIVAAGRSRRMGERNKLLLEVGDHPVLTRVLRAVSRAPVSEIIVVTGAQHERVASLVEREGSARTVHNPDFSSGMASSIRRGVRAAPTARNGYLLCPGDLPLLSGRTAERLCQAFADQPPPCIVAPTHEGQQGHPVLFSSAFREGLLALEGDEGARGLVRRDGAPLTRVPVADGGILQDVDTPEALRTARRRAEQDTAKNA